MLFIGVDFLFIIDRTPPLTDNSRPDLTRLQGPCLILEERLILSIHHFFFYFDWYMCRNWLKNTGNVFRELKFL